MLAKIEQEANMDKDTQVVELQEIYREMDVEGKKKIVAAAANLLDTQKALSSLDSPPGHEVFQKTRCITGAFRFIVTGLLLLFAAYAFWVTLINPALLTTGITPLVMLRVITTALCGMLCLGMGLIWFILRKFSILWMLLAVGAGILCVEPGILTDFFGFALVLLILTVQFLQGKQNKTATAG